MNHMDQLRPVCVCNMMLLSVFLILTNELWMHGRIYALDTLERQLLAARLPRGWELREALEKLDKDLYDNGPSPERPFVSALKNPCWAAKAKADDGELNCLPYAMVMGGFHCGAASLWQALYKHPLVVKSDVSRWHFWAEMDKTMSGYLAGTSRAATRIAAWPLQIDAAAKGAGGSGAASLGFGEGGSVAWLRRQQKILLDGSSSTFAFYWSPNVRAHRAFVKAMVPCWESCHKAHREGAERESCLEDCYATARQADRQLAANLGLPYNEISLPLLVSAVYGRRPPKMVVLVRNPVDRLYSAYWRYGHYRDKFGPTPEGFETYAREQLTALKDCMNRNGSESEISCLLHFETWGLKEERLYFHADQLLRGVYSVWLEIWLKFFDRKDLLVVRSEDFFADPVDVYSRVAEWLGLDLSAIDYHARIERLGKAKTPEEAAQAMQAPIDDKLWNEIRQILLRGERDDVLRYEFNARQAKLAAQGQQKQGDSGGGRPPMLAAIRRELTEFYAPYNQRLAQLLEDPNFIRGWD
ncbi:hypothetical protein VaNZ11_015457 [Volvox africanus]|uniref:Sulfotransferase n=1 Tax=Volvox africanus TaxID=51714 RepID=A0ABQ5SLN7_9CHLO|nr:hypothetical protein VaNZ11_015457 [Volvox africanus]